VRRTSSIDSRSVLDTPAAAQHRLTALKLLRMLACTLVSSNLLSQASAVQQPVARNEDSQDLLNAVVTEVL
jgi:hypothetical protein